MDTNERKINSSFTYLVILAILIALGIAGRLLPHPPNFTPMAAIALFSGFIFMKRYMAILAVGVTMLLTDYFAFGFLSPEWFASKSMYVYESLNFSSCPPNNVNTGACNLSLPFKKSNSITNKNSTISAPALRANSPAP